MKEISLEEVPEIPVSHTIGEAVRVLWNDPSLFIRYWNYKGAIFSGILRAPIFFGTYLIGKEALRLALLAALVQFVFRFFFAGISGALIQAFRKVEPAWKALLTIMVLVPTVSHLFEFVLQSGFGYLTATQDQTSGAILRSICVSIISALFTLFAMRRGVMIVGEAESKSLISDISRLPLVIFHFLAFIPNEVSYMLRRGAYLAAVLVVAGFGIFSQLLIWAVTNKPSWTHSNGQEVFLAKYWGVDGMILLIIAVIISSVVFQAQRLKRKEHQ